MKTLKIAAFLLLAATSVSLVNASVSADPVGIEKPAGSVIDQFLAGITGSEADAEALVKKYCTPEVIANGMIPFGKNPKIVKREGNCVRFTLEWEESINEYTLCEENGKINVFEMYFGEEEED